MARTNRKDAMNIADSGLGTDGGIERLFGLSRFCFGLFLLTEYYLFYQLYTIHAACLDFVSAYFSSQNTIYSTSSTLFMPSAEQGLNSAGFLGAESRALGVATERSEKWQRGSRIPPCCLMLLHRSLARKEGLAAARQRARTPSVDHEHRRTAPVLGLLARD